MSLVQVTKSTTGSGDLLTRSTNTPTSSQTFTVIFRNVRDTGSASATCCALRENATENLGAGLGVYVKNTGQYLVNSWTGAAYAGYGESSILTVTTTVAIALVSDGTNIRTYYMQPGGAITAGPTRTALSFTPALLVVAASSNNGTNKYGGYYVWNRALSLGEISRQFFQRAPWGGGGGLIFGNACLGASMHADETGTGGALTQGTDLSQSSVAGEPKVPWRLRGFTSYESPASSLSGTADYSAWSAAGAIDHDCSLAGTGAYSGWSASGALDGNPNVGGTGTYAAWGAAGALTLPIVLAGTGLYAAWAAIGSDGGTPLDTGTIIVPYRTRLRFIRR